jgi:hypothetical protein
MGTCLVAPWRNGSVSPRRARQLCEADRYVGAHKVSTVWAIPAAVIDAEAA